MRKRSGDRRPYMPPVSRIEVSEGNLKLRGILLVVLLLIAGGAIAMGVHYALSKEPGWQEVQSASNERNCGDDFVFLYECGSTGVSATAEYKGVTALYSRLTQEAFSIFTAEEALERQNVQYLNAHVNETVTVDPVLYQALALLDAYNCRIPFLAPVVREYNGVFLSAGDGEAVLYDPVKNPERAAYVQEALRYAGDPQMVSLALLGENRVQLLVADAYLDYAKENEITVFLDFGWIKNAFIADYLAENLAQSGYTNGYLVSHDGFTRNLDTRDVPYGLNLFDRLENTVFMPVQLSYTGPMSIVSLRNYPLSEKDRWNYYAYEDGTVTSVYLNETTGMPLSATDNLVSYSREAGCAEILMQTAPLFLAETFDEAQVLKLAEKEIHSIWAEEQMIFHTQEDADLTLLAESGGEGYMLQDTK